MQEAGELAATTAKLLNVSEFTSVDEATSALVSSLQAFTTKGQDVGQRAEEIVDILNHIGNRYPVATNELADGLATSSAALVAANNSIEEQVALLSAGNATMQDISTVASGLKIVAARLRGTTTDIDDDADSAITNVSKLQSKIKALTAEANGGEGIDIINEQGEYKSTYEILTEISKIFDKMDDVSSASLLELIAGKNRSSVVAAILQNGEILEKAYADAFKADSSSQKELDTYLSSIQGRIDLFNNSVQTMWMNLLDTDVIKGVVNLGTSFIQFLDSSAGRVTALGAALSILGKVLKIAPVVSSANGQLQILGKTVETIKNNFAQLSEQSTGAFGKIKSAFASVFTDPSAGKIDLSGMLSEDSFNEKLNGLISGFNNIDQSINAISWDDYVNGVSKSDQAMGAALKTCTSHNGTIIAGANAYQAYTGAATTAAVGTSTVGGAAQATTGKLIAMKVAALAANAALTMGLSLIISLAIKGVTAWANAGETARKAAQDAVNASEELKEQNESLKDYKDQIRELRTELDSNTLSESEAYDAREKLLTIQNELIDKFGLERDGINLVTGAIEDQIAAIDALSQKDAQQWLNNNQKSINEAIDFFDNPVKGGYLDSIGTSTTITNWGVTSNVSDMIREYANNPDNSHIEVGTTINGIGQDINFTGSAEEVKTQVEDFQDWLGTKETELQKELTGLTSMPASERTDDIKNKIESLKKDIEQLQDVREDLGTEYTNWFGENSTYSANKALLEETQYNTAITKYAEQYGDILAAQTKLSEAQAKGDKDGIKSAIETINFETAAAATIAEANGESYMASFFNGIQSEYAKLSNEIKFETDLFENILFGDSGKGVQDVLSEALSGLEGMNAKEILQLGEIDPNNTAFVSLNQIAQSYGMTIEELCNSLVKLKYIQSGFGAETESNVVHLSAKTYSELTEEVESYNNILSQTSEIVSDNTEVTQEYKDSLKALGISEEELGECFYKNNPLIVKNSTKLNNLVKSAKKATSQNIKLAKSQARLQYYKLYKELSQLTNGRKIANGATLAQVNSLYKEMNALQKTIARYTILEQKLLGATNAYEEFAKAQELDSEIDYESKAEEMVGYLVDAFHTAKLGTESAQAAIKGLVPESVYADLDTLDEKMQAVYDYFTTDLSKYFYVKFNDDGSLESAEMLIDNVKQFVEDGIAEGVFTGSWEEWDLDPSIKSLDQLAKQMNVTKEVAFAFLQAMETYDISWIGGDSSTLMDKLLPTSAEVKAFGEQMKDAYQNAGLDKDIDLTQRVKVSREVMLDKGWDIGDDTYSTVNTISAYASEFGLVGDDGSDYAINLTPILPDGTVIEGGEDAFKDWIREQLAGGKTLDDLDIVLGVYADMDSAIQEAEKLHKLQEDYYAMVDSHSLENDIYSTTQKQAELQYKIGTGQIAPDTIVGADGQTTAAEQLAQLNREAEENAKAARENAAAWAEAQEAYDKASGTVSDLQDQLEKSVDDKEIKEIQRELEAAEDTMWDTYAALVKLGEPTELTLSVAEEQVQKDLEKIKAKMSNVELDIVSQINIEDLKKDSDGNWIVDITAYSNLDPTSQARVQEYLDYINEQHVIDALQGDGVTTTLDTLNEIKDILQKSYELMVTATIDETYVNTWWQEFSSAPWYKKIYMVAEKAFSDGWASGTVGVDGTAHAIGTAHKNGSWGAPRTETALVGELGPELLVRNGRWTTVGDNGAEFRHIKKGDIIFNHKQTEDLLSRGYVTGRGKLHGDLAFASGTAYAVHPWTGGMDIGDDWDNITPDIWNDATNGEYLEDAADSLSDAADDAEQVVDFIEMKLEEIEAIIEKTSTRISNFLDDTTDIKSKDELYDELVKAEKDKSEAYLKAAQKYNVEAAAALSGVPQKYQEMARNGAIAIKEFLGEDQVEIAEKIQEYRDWAAKADEAENGRLEAIAAISAHRVEQLEDIATDFENIVSISKSHSDLLQAEMDFIEESGNRLSESYYEELKKHSQKQLDDMQNERAALQKILDDSVAAGDVIIGSDDWYSMLETIYEVDQEIIDCKTSLEEFQNAINDLYWDNFDKLIAEIDAVDSELSNLFDLISDNDKIVDDMGHWTADGYTALGLLVQQMEVAQQKSKEYGDAISKLKKDYKDGLYSTDEYNEKLAELTDGQYDAIKSYEDAKDAIIDLNKTRVDAVKDGIEKEIDAYEELISKKKESLDADKDARDFERSVEDSNKSISDVERKIASLKGNTSSSAIAERRRLEEELRKLQQEREDLFYDESVENQQEALDKELENFKDAKNKEIEDLEEYLKNQEKVLQDSFAIVQENTQQIAGKLVEIAEDYGVTISDTVATPWINGTNAIGTYEEQLNTSVSSTTKNLETLKQQLKDLETQADKTANSVINATHSSITTANDGHQTSIKGYAKGSKSVEYDQWALIDELGDELQLVPNKAGRLDYIKKGTGILNNTLTERLMDLAMDPTSMLENSKPVVGAPGIITTNNTFTIDASVGTLLHVEHLDGSNPAEVTKLVDKAWEKKMQTLNNSIKKFTR